MTLTTQTIEFAAPDGTLRLGKICSSSGPGQLGLIWYALVLMPDATNAASFHQIWMSRGHLSEKLARAALRRQIKASQTWMPIYKSWAQYIGKEPV